MGPTPEHDYLTIGLRVLDLHPVQPSFVVRNQVVVAVLAEGVRELRLAPSQVLVQRGLAVRRARNYRGMWQVTVVCSSCAEESDVLVENLDDVEREVCECGYSFVVVSVAAFEPVEVEGGELVELRRRDDMPLAA